MWLPEMSDQNEERRPPADQAGEAAAKRVGETGTSVTRDQQPRRPSDRAKAVDYHAMGFDLGYAERAAIGSALLVLERAE